MNNVEKIAQFIEEVSYEKLPEIVTNLVKRAFVDTVGVTIAGVNEDACKIITEFAKENQGKPCCSVIGADFKTNAIDAALVNGTLLHSLDFDDTGAYTQGHPSAPIFPAILATAEEINTNGKEVIEAYVVGVEIHSRLSQGIPMLHMKGWHPTSVFGTIAAAASVSKIQKLNTKQIMSALSIAGSMSSGLIANFGTMTKPFHIGKAASNGILASKLAQKGFTASHQLFDGESNFQKSFGMINSNAINESIQNIGNPLRIVTPGISIKRYASCSLTHKAIDAVLSLIKENPLKTEEIESIECFVSPRALNVLFYSNPASKLEAKFSMHFVIAAALVFGDLKLEHFSDSVVNHPEIVSMISKISLKIHDDWKDGDDLRGDKVVIRLKNGQTLLNEVAIPKGSSKNPLNEIELIEKFRQCTTPIFNNQTQNVLLELINNLENLDSVKNIINTINNNFELEDEKT